MDWRIAVAAVFAMGCTGGTLTVTGGDTDQIGSDTDKGTVTDTDVSTDTDPDIKEPDTKVYDPSDDGPYEVRKESVEVTLGDRQLDGRVFLPRGVEGAPLAIINHGFNLRHGDYASYGNHLASHGIVTLTITWDNGLLGSRNHAELAEDFLNLLDELEELEDDVNWLHEQADLDIRPKL